MVSVEGTSEQSAWKKGTSACVRGESRDGGRETKSQGRTGYAKKRWQP